MKRITTPACLVAILVAILAVMFSFGNYHEHLDSETRVSESCPACALTLSPGTTADAAVEFDRPAAVRCFVSEHPDCLPDTITTGNAGSRAPPVPS